ncbi:uncharacterized protein LOC135211051 [Macrobrachium nipponense]|uniref:uncharacterized protein LOC135211051 n=1 Tax=Macrobrachium nipponense TaxID=159736 RepID=UPI0030C7A251
MYKLLIFPILAAVAMAQVQNPALAPLTRLSIQDIEQVMQDSGRVKFIVTCLLAKKPCPEDPLADPVQVLVRGWADSKTICGDCSHDDQRKTRTMISILQQRYRDDYNNVAKAYGLA